MTSFTQTFGGSAVNPSDVAYAAYSFSISAAMFWPQFAEGQTNVTARFMNITTTVASLNISLPDATLASVGYDTIIFNAGSNSFNVVNFGNGAICTIAPGQTFYILLNNNGTQNGTWQTVQFGVGTGSAVASALAGPGLLAAAGLLQVNLNGNNVSSSFSLTTAGLAQLYVWTGGSGTITIPSASSVGSGFFFLVANNGSGNLTISPSSTTIDGGTTSVFSQTQSGFIISNGANWYTVGKGIQNTFAVTLLNLNVAGSSNVTETSAQAQNIIQQYTGALTGNIAVIVPATVQLYEVNNMTTGAFTLTVKTPSGTGIVVPQGQTSILYCDGTNVVNGFTASVTSTISLTNGSASAPAVSFAASPTTGLFSPGSGLISVTAGANEVMRFASQASAVNYFGVVSSATTSALALGASGTDTNIGINIIPKGSGTVTLGSLNGTAIGAATASSAAFTTLSASSTVSGSGFSTYLASPPAIGGSAAAAGSFTTLSASSTVSGSGFSTYLASPPAIGGSAASSGAFTTLSASSTVSGSGFSTYLASPPAIGGSAAAAITGTTITATTFNGAGTGLTGTASGLNIGGNAATATNLGGTPALPNGTTATTQSAGNNSVRLATTAYVDRLFSSQNVVTGSRSFGTVYQNTNGRPMFITITCTYSGGGPAVVTIFTDSSSTPATPVAAMNFNTNVSQMPASFMVMPGNYYTVSDTTAIISEWIEWF